MKNIVGRTTKRNGGQMLKWAVASALLLGVFTLSGCSKALTESSAVSLVQKFSDNQQNEEMRKRGHPVIDSCDHLVLVIETMATAECKIHVKLTKAGEAIFGNAPQTGIIRASFSKKPDGSWVCTSAQ